MSSQIVSSLCQLIGFYVKTSTNWNGGGFQTQAQTTGPMKDGVYSEWVTAAIVGELRPASVVRPFFSARPATVRTWSQSMPISSARTAGMWSRVVAGKGVL
jgi:hypothetical protein